MTNIYTKERENSDRDLSEFNFEGLCDIAKQLKITQLDARSLNFFRSAFESPPSMRNLYMVIDNLEVILPILREICQNSSFERSIKPVLNRELTLPELIKIRTKKILLKEFTVDLDLKYNSKGSRNRNNSFRGLIQRWPLWSTLGFRPVLSKSLQPFFHLLAHTLLALAVLRKVPSQGRLGKVKIATLDHLRSLANDQKDEELPLVPAASLPPVQFFAALRDLPGYLKIQAVADLVEEAVAYMEGGDTSPSWSKKPGSNRDLPEPKEPPLPLEGGSGDPDDEEPEGGIEVLPANPDSDPLALSRAHLAGKHIAKANQLFPFALSALSRRDVRLLHNLETVSSCSPESLPEMAMLQMMFWSGFDIPRLAGIVVGDAKEAENLPGVDLFDPVHRTLVISSPYPILKTPVQKEAQPQLYSRQSWIDITLPSVCTDVISRYFSKYGVQGQKYLFPWDKQEIEKRCKVFMRKLNNTAGAHFSLARVRDYLYQRMSRIGAGDPGLANLVLGRKGHLGKIKTHYLSLEVRQLKYHYRLTADSILCDVGLGPVPSYPSAFPGGQNVGTPKRPRPEVVKKLVEDLKHTLAPLETDQRLIETKDELVTFHNQLTVYTALLMAFATGYRAICGPAVPKFSVAPTRNEASGRTSRTGSLVPEMTILQDKDSGDHYHTRMVRVPGVCRRHLADYQGYLGDLLANCQNLKSNFKGLSERTLFFLEDNGEGIAVREFSPAHLKELLENDFGYHPAINANRSFLRSEWNSLGGSPEAIEHFLGHWNRGEEPFSRSSGLHPADYKNALDKNLAELLESINFQSLDKLPGVGVAWRVHSVVLAQKNRLNSRVGWDRGERPGELWIKAMGKAFQGKSPNESFTRIQQGLLKMVQRHLPELYRAGPDLKVSQAKIDHFYYRIVPRKVDGLTIFKRQTYLGRLLQYGNSTYNWGVKEPAAPRFLVKEKNLLRRGMSSSLTLFHEIEQAFALDLEQDPPEDVTQRVGQILLSGIFYGGLLSRGWLECVPQALKSGLYQYDDWLWLDLWKGSKPEEEFVRFRQQMIPSIYRRWFPDPTTQRLVYKWLEQDIEGRNSYQIDAVLALKEYLEQRLGRRFKISFKTKDEENKDDEKENKQIGIDTLLRCGRAHALTFLPPFLVAYACNQISSASLPDERWIRLLTGRTITVERPHDKDFLAPPRPFLQATFFRPEQKGLRLELCRLMPRVVSKKKKLTEADFEKVRNDIKTWVEGEGIDPCPVVQLLAAWSLELLSPKTALSGSSRQKADPLEFNSVQDYLCTIGNLLIDAFGPLDPLEMDGEDLQSHYEDIISTVQQSEATPQEGSSTPQGNEKSDQPMTGEDPSTTYSRRVALCLRRFQDFLESRFGAQPCPAEDDASSRVVSANFFTDDEYQRMLDELGWGRPMTRLQRVQSCVLILGYRAGLRRAEILGLRLKDVTIDEETDIMIRRHSGRRTKSSSATRNVPFDLQAPAEELALVRSWVADRAREPGVRPRDFLFAASIVERRMPSDEEVMVPIRKIIKKVTGDQLAVFHHTRHSFYSNMVTKLMLRDDIHSNPLPVFANFSTPMQRGLREAIVGNRSTGQGKLYNMAILIGHADVPTGLHNYGHLCDWMLGYFSRHSLGPPTLSRKAWTQLLGLSQANADKVRSEKRFPYVDALRVQADKFAVDLSHPQHARASWPRPNERRPEPGLALPQFDEAYRNASILLRRNKRKLALPTARTDIEILKRWYQILIQQPRNSRRRLLRLAIPLCARTRSKDPVRVDTYQQLRDALEFMKALEINKKGLLLLYHPPETTTLAWREHRLSQWQGKMAEPVITISMGAAGKHKKPGYVSMGWVGDEEGLPPLELIPLLALCFGEGDGHSSP